MSGGSSCLICNEAAFASFDNKLLTSAVCGHKICRRCLNRQSSREPGNLSKGQDSGSKSNPLMCPLCSNLAIASDWADREAEDSELEQEKLVRERISAVYNLSREDFDASPPYNDFLEKRETMIYDLVFGTGDSEKRQLLEELESYEIENQKQIVECKQRSVKMNEAEVREIVEKEGIFYELVRQNFGPGFRNFTSSNATLLHPLKRAYPELFVSDGDGSMNGNNEGSNDIAMDVNVIGAGGQPKPLQSTLVYNKIPRKIPTDKALLLRACGLSKELIGQRVLLELWGGLAVGINA